MRLDRSHCSNFKSFKVFILFLTFSESFDHSHQQRAS